jgi:hypothetical protein
MPLGSIQPPVEMSTKNLPKEQTTAEDERWLHCHLWATHLDNVGNPSVSESYEPLRHATRIALQLYYITQILHYSFILPLFCLSYNLPSYWHPMIFMFLNISQYIKRQVLNINHMLIFQVMKSWTDHWTTWIVISFLQQMHIHLYRATCLWNTIV